MEKRERILEEAEKLFSQKGYYGLSLSELLARCDIPKGSFYSVSYTHLTLPTTERV